MIRKKLTENLMLSCYVNFLALSDQIWTSPRLNHIWTHTSRILKNMLPTQQASVQEFGSCVKYVIFFVITVQDLLDLRAYNWVPRRQEVSPKTFSELEAEAAVKEYEEELGIAQQISPRPRPATSTTMVQPEPPKPQSQPQSKPKTAKKKKAKGKSDQMTIEEPVFISSEGEFMEKLIPILEEYLFSSCLVDI